VLVQNTENSYSDAKNMCLFLLFWQQKQMPFLHLHAFYLTAYSPSEDQVMSAYFCPHSVFNSGYLIEFMCFKSDLIDNYDN